MDVSQIPIDLSRLTIKLEEVLNSTTRTKNTLSTSYVSVKKLLGRWRIPDTFSNDEPLECTCAIDSDDSVNDVAKNIEEIVEKAKKLREQWTSSSQIQQKKSLVTQSANKQRISSKPLLKYSAHLPINNSTVTKKVHDTISKKIETGPVTKQILNNGIGIDNDAKKIGSKLPVSKKGLLNAKLSRTSFNLINTASATITNGNSKKSIMRPQSKSTSSLRTTYQKDFIPQTLRKSFKYASSKDTPHIKSKEGSVKDDNLESLKNCVSFAVKDKQSEKKKLSFVSNSGKVEMAELEELLNQVTIYPTLAVKNDKIKESQTKVSSCKLHGNNTVQSCENKFRLVGLEEAIDVLGVPPELVKNLKTYHSFLSAKSSYITSKGQLSANSFANKLSQLNDSRLKNLTYEPLVGLFSEYIVLTTELSMLSNCNSFEDKRKNVAHFKEKSEELEIKFRKWSTVDESVHSNLKFSSINVKEHMKTNCLQASLEGWDIIGMWYINSRRRAQGLEKMRCIKYSNKSEWKKFDANMQRMQRLEFQLEIFDIIEKIIFPQLSIYNPQDSTFVALFKTASSLCNVTSLRPPLVIKSS